MRWMCVRVCPWLGEHGNKTRQLGESEFNVPEKAKSHSHDCDEFPFTNRIHIPLAIELYRYFYPEDGLSIEDRDVSDGT